MRQGRRSARRAFINHGAERGEKEVEGCVNEGRRRLGELPQFLRLAMCCMLSGTLLLPPLRGRIRTCTGTSKHMYTYEPRTCTVSRTASARVRLGLYPSSLSAFKAHQPSSNPSPRRAYNTHLLTAIPLLHRHSRDDKFGQDRMSSEHSMPSLRKEG